MNTLAIRFATSADTTGGELACWPWMGCRNELGYGLIRVDGRLERAHRVAVILDGRPAPTELEVCHECDNPPCVNPRHLYVGPHSENMRDMRARGRGNAGEKNGASRLTAASVASMRSDRTSGMSYDELMARYGVSRSTVSRIITRQGWL